MSSQVRSQMKMCVCLGTVVFWGGVPSLRLACDLAGTKCDLSVVENKMRSRLLVEG